MGNISPSPDAFNESLSTLKFCTRAKHVKNEARINEDMDQRALLRNYETELRRLRAALCEKNKTVVDMRKVLQLEDEKKKAEEDKIAAIKALEEKSREFLHEKENKKILENKIAAMQSQLLIGGQRVEDTPQFKNAVEAQQKAIRQE